MSRQTIPGTWIQLDQREAAKLAKLYAKAPMAGAIMTTFMAVMDGEDAIVMSHALIAARLDISVKTVARAVKTLQQAGCIKVIQIGSAGTTNAYLLNADLAWQGPRIGLRTAKFKATVIAFEPEQQAGTIDGNALLQPVQTELEDAIAATQERGQ